MWAMGLSATYLSASFFQKLLMDVNGDSHFLHYKICFVICSLQFQTQLMVTIGTCPIGMGCVADISECLFWCKYFYTYVECWHLCSILMEDLFFVSLLSFIIILNLDPILLYFLQFLGLCRSWWQFRVWYRECMKVPRFIFQAWLLIVMSLRSATKPYSATKPW